MTVITVDFSMGGVLEWQSGPEDSKTGFIDVTVQETQ
jgi:hypothetical protein